MNRKGLILTDGNDKFLIAINEKAEYVTMSTAEIKKNFHFYGFDLEIQQFSQLDFSKSYKDYFILYQTSELMGNFYKGFIEDIMFFFEKQGALLLPSFEYLKAHHNKVYMELLRENFINKDLKTIKSKIFASKQEGFRYEPNYPVVIKQASGSGSEGVFLARNRSEYEKSVEKVSRVFIYDSVYSFFKDEMKKILKPVIKKKINKIDRKFVVQNFVENLSGDYKVLYFGGKYYSLYRENRENDFRASGGGKLHKVPKKENLALLNFARKVVDEIDFPIIGMDIGFDGEKYHLLEFQMIHLGPYTLQTSESYFTREDEEWIEHYQTSNLEVEFTRSIVKHLKEKKVS